MFPTRNDGAGWMVTGKGQENIKHLANAIAERGPDGLTLNRKTEGHAASDLSVFFPSDIHLTEGSDILAMLAHDHQVSAHYQLNEAQYRVRQGLFDSKQDLKSGREALVFVPSDDWKGIDKSITKLLRYLLFADEPALTNPIQGHGAYLADFQANKRLSSNGDSLKDLDLKTRLLKNRLSWMVYSRAFEGLPRALKEEFYHRLWKILTEPGGVEGFDHLEKDEKARIREILVETKKGLPDYWKRTSTVASAPKD